MLKKILYDNQGSSNELLRSKLNAISNSRREFIECEANEKLHWVIQSDLRPVASLVYQAEDHVLQKWLKPITGHRNSDWKSK